MSFFGRTSASHPATDEPCSIEDTQLDTEVGDGVVVERRSMLWLSAGAVASLLVGSAPVRAQDAPRPKQQEGSGKLSFAEFLEQAYPLARRIVDSKGEDEEAYLLTIAAAMSRLRDPGAPLRQAMREFRKSHGKEGERFPLIAVSIKLEPGRGFPHHDHLNYNGVILGIEGSARIRNYDFQGEAPPLDSTDTFQVRETRDDLILPGRFSTLGRNRENIHDVTAGKDGARVLDVFTFFEKNATSRYLEVAPEPRDKDARIYEATWKQRRR